MRQSRHVKTTLEACAEAIELLKVAGFEVVSVSMKSEATYLRFPGRSGVLRVADHPGGKPMPGLDRIISRITFLPHQTCKVPGSVVLTEDAIHSRVSKAIGAYMIASARPMRPTYRGPKEKIP